MTSQQLRVNPDNSPSLGPSRQGREDRGKDYLGSLRGYSRFSLAGKGIAFCLTQLLYLAIKLL